MQLRKVDAADQAFIKLKLKEAQTFVSAEIGGKDINLNTLDAAWSHFLAREREDAERSKVINAVGIAFGQALADAAALQWVGTTDDAGLIDVALQPRKGKSGLLINPADLIARRYDENTPGTLAALFASLMEQVNAAAASAKPSWKFW